MDPNACLRAFAVAVANHDTETANDRHEDLMVWLDNGGFAPDWGRNGLPTRKMFAEYDPFTGEYKR